MKTLHRLSGIPVFLTELKNNYKKMSFITIVKNIKIKVEEVYGGCLPSVLIDSLQDYEDY